jgi:hypothetical protein
MVQDKSDNDSMYEYEEQDDTYEIFEEEEDVFDETVFIASRETYSTEVFKLISKNYKNLKNDKQRVKLNVKIKNLTDMLMDYDKNKDVDNTLINSNKKQLSIYEPNLHPVLNVKHIVFENANDKKMYMALVKTWNDSNASIRDFSSFLYEWDKINTFFQKASNNVERSKKIYQLFRPFINKNIDSRQHVTVSQDIDSFSFVTTKGKDESVKKQKNKNENVYQIVLTNRVINSDDFSYQDNVEVTGFYRVKNKDKLNDYRTLDLEKYVDDVLKLKENDKVNVYPHDYIPHISHNGDVEPTLFNITKKNDLYLHLEKDDSSHVELIYNLKKLSINRFMIYPKNVINPMTKHKSLKMNTFFKLSPNVSLFEQTEFITTSPSTTLFNLFKKVKYLSYVDLLQLDHKLNYDSTKFSPLSQFIYKLIQENVRKIPSPKQIIHFPNFKNKNRFIDILQKVSYESSGQFADTPYNRVLEISKKPDGGLLNLITQFNEYISKLSEMKSIKKISTSSVKSQKHESQNKVKDRFQDENAIVVKNINALFEENERLKINQNDGSNKNAQNSGILYDVFKNVIYIQKVKTSEGWYTWTLNKEFNKKMMGNTFKLNYNIFDVLKHQKENIKQVNHFIDHKVNYLQKIKEYETYLTWLKHAPTVTHKLTPMKLDLSYTKKDFLGENKDDPYELIEDQENFNVKYEPFFTENSNDDDLSNQLLQEKDYFNIQTSSMKTITELIGYLSRTSQIQLQQDEISVIAHYNIMHQNENKIIQEYETSKHNLEAMVKWNIAKKAKTIEERRRLLKYKDLQVQKLDLTYKDNFQLNRYFITINIFAFFIVYILAKRPSQIINYIAECKKNVSDVQRNPREAHIHYFVCLMNVISKNVDMTNIFSSYFTYTNIQKRIDKHKDLKEAVTHLSSKAPFAFLIEKADKKIFDSENVFLSHTWIGFKPFTISGHELINTQKDITTNGNKRKNQGQIIVDYILNVHTHISNPNVNNGTNLYEDKKARHHKPGNCCFEQYLTYGNFVPLDIENRIINVKPILHPRPFTLFIKRTNTHFKPHVFYSVPLTFFKKVIDMKTFISNSDITYSDNSNRINSYLDNKEYNNEYIKILKSSSASNESQLIDSVSDIFSNVKQFLAVAFPSSKNKNDDPLSIWNELTKSLLLFQQPTDKYVYHNIVHKMMKDILITIEREERGYKYSDSHLKNRKHFENVDVERLTGIHMKDMDIFQLNTSSAISQTVIQALKSFNLDYVNTLFFPIHRSFDDVFYNHLVVLLLFGLMIQKAFHFILNIHEREKYRKLDDSSIKLPNMFISMNENQRLSMSVILNKIKQIFDIEKNNSITHFQVLKDDFENLREKHNKERRMMAITTHENNLSKLMLNMQVDTDLTNTLFTNKSISIDDIEIRKTNDELTHDESVYNIHDGLTSDEGFGFQDRDEAYDIPDMDDD